MSATTKKSSCQLAVVGCQKKQITIHGDRAAGGRRITVEPGLKPRIMRADR